MAEGNDRRQQLARIHMARKQLGLDEEIYRLLLQRVTGKRSSGEMTSAQRNAVIAEFVRLGFKGHDHEAHRQGFSGRPKGVDAKPMLRKVEALLADSKRPWSYAHAMANQMFKAIRVEWLHDDQLHKLIAALQVDANRRSRERGRRASR